MEQIPAACPGCRAAISRREYFHSGPRACRACGIMIVPSEPWNWIGNIVAGVVIAGAALVGIVGFAAELLDPLLAMALPILILLLGYVLFPYVTPFTFAEFTEKCLRCGYDLRATPMRCPECGTPVPPRASAPIIPPTHE